MFCKHEWELVSETITKSKFEAAIAALREVGIEKLTLPRQLADGNRKHIQTFTCKKCGKLKRFVEDL
jgi:hypothetical protein